MFSSDDIGGDTLIAIIGSDKTIGRVGANFYFTGEDSKGQIRNYHWDFGDGSISNEMNSNHSYENLGWYNVSLIIEDENGKTANSTIVIGVQCHDISEYGDTSRRRDLRPIAQTGFSIFSDIGPNIGQPVIETHGVIQEAIGSFTFKIEVWTHLPGDDSEVQIIHEETLQGNGENIQYSYTNDPTDLNENIQKYPSYIAIDLLVDQGRWGGAEMYLNAIYPMEGLTITQ